MQIDQNYNLELYVCMCYLALEHLTSICSLSETQIYFYLFIYLMIYIVAHNTFFSPMSYSQTNPTTSVNSIIVLYFLPFLPWQVQTNIYYIACLQISGNKIIYNRYSK